MLWFEFDRVTRELASGHAWACAIPLPADLAWATRGNHPKRRQVKVGAGRLEDLERNLHWLYLCDVQRPHVPKYRLAKEQKCARSTVQAAVHRARTLLDCVSTPVPPAITPDK